MVPLNQRLGRVGEWVALLWLTLKGYRVRHRNWRAAGGELDLVMERQRVIVFVEVKTRSGSDFGGAAAAVNRHKRRVITRCAAAYLGRFGLWERPSRFDVVAIERRSGPFRWRLVHQRDAFQSDLGRSL